MARLTQDTHQIFHRQVAGRRKKLKRTFIFHQIIVAEAPLPVKSGKEVTGAFEVNGT